MMRRVASCMAFTSSSDKNFNGSMMTPGEEIEVYKYTCKQGETCIPIYESTVYIFEFSLYNNWHFFQRGQCVHASFVGKVKHEGMERFFFSLIKRRLGV